MGLKILIVDDQKMVREGLHSLLGMNPNIELITEAEDGHQALKLVTELKPDVVIMDVIMPSLNGIEQPDASWPKFHSQK